MKRWARSWDELVITFLQQLVPCWKSYQSDVWFILGKSLLSACFTLYGDFIATVKVKMIWLVVLKVLLKRGVRIEGVFMVLARMCEGETEKLCWMTFFRYHENIFIVNWLLFPFSHKSMSKVQYRCWVAPIWRYSSSQRCWMGIKTGLCLVSTHQTGKPRCWPCAQGACETAAHFLFPTQEFGNHHSYQLTLTKCLLL